MVCRQIGREQEKKERENRILFSHKQNKIFPFANTWMDLEDIMPREIKKQRKTNTV